MKGTLLIFFNALCLYASAQLTDEQIHDLKTGKVKPEAGYIYWLPYEKGERYLFIQGANSSFSHKNELSYDFKMATGSKVCAAREGVVTGTKEDSNKGGLKDEFLSEGNHIVIRHADGSMAQYWHLQQNGALVSIGDSVKKGQVIGLSGNTGYTAFPHLHFQLFDADGKQILGRFQTKKGIIYIRPGRWYKAVR